MGSKNVSSTRWAPCNSLLVGTALRVIFATTLLALGSANAFAQPPEHLKKFLRDVIKFNDTDFAAVEKGEVVTRLLPATDKGEIAAFGIVRVNATVDQLERLAKDPKRFHAMEGVEQLGMFDMPPKPTNVAALQIPKQDIEALKKCKPGSCDVKLTDDELDRLQKIDWSAGDASAQAAQGMKQMLVDLAEAYHRGGLATLGTMVDKKQPKSRAEEFHRLLQNSPYLYKYIPEFHDYIEKYPTGKFKGSTTHLFWMKDTFSPKPVISVCASSVARVEDNVVIGCRQLAATHFFNAGLDVSVGVPSQKRGQLYIVDFYRVRIDPPTGMLAGPAMHKVESGIEEGVGKSLSGIRKKLESR